MDTRPRVSDIGPLVLLGLSTFLIIFGFCNAHAQTESQPVAPPSREVQTPASDKPAADKPLPDINSLMVQVEAQEKASRRTIRQYIYRSLDTAQMLNSHGAVKKTSTEERENFWINGVYINRLLARDGKPISGDELKKQNERIDKRIADARGHDEKNAADEPPQKKRDSDEVTFARFLELGAFSMPRRVQLNGRDTIAVDYAGDPKAKTSNRLEGAIHDLAGTVWVDEKDHALVRVEGRFLADFKLGGGLLANVHKGTSFQADWTKVNDEVWLPARIDAQGSARVLLFINFNGAIHATDSDYRKFRANSTILPGVVEASDVPEDTQPTQVQP